MACVFVTGTGTGIGKTVVTAALVAAARMRGIDAVPMKPIQTGCDVRGGGTRAPDLDYVLRAAGLTMDEAAYELMAPYRLRMPAAPHLAARHEHCVIEFGRIVSAFEVLSRRHEMVVAEGAGGIMVPVNDRQHMGDLVLALGLPALVVAAPGLGTINHTLLTLAALRTCGIRVLGVVFSSAESGPWGEIEADNLRTVERWGNTPVLGTVPFIPALDGLESSRPLLENAGAALLDALGTNAGR